MSFNLLQSMNGHVNGGDILRNAIYTVIIVGVVLIVRFVILRLVGRRMKDRVLYRHWQKNSGYIVFLICLFVCLPLWLPSLQGIAAVIGIFGAGILIVNKEILMNISGWFYIIVRKPFDVGNRVGIMGVYGDVIDIRLMGFTMIETAPPRLGGQSTGRIIHMPNSALLIHPLSNASKEFVFNWNEIRVPLTLQSDWQKAQSILEEIAFEKVEQLDDDDARLKRSEDVYMIKFNRLRPIVYLEFRGGAIVLTIRHLCEAKNRRVLTDRIWREVLIRFAAEPDITLNEDFDEKDYL